MAKAEKIRLENINFDNYIFDKEKGIWSKHFKRWLTGHMHYDDKKRDMISL